MIQKSNFGDIYYEVSGPKGKHVIVFCHGVGMDHRTFEHQVSALQGDYQVIVWDMPGHGQSTLTKNDVRYSLAAAECLIGILNETDTDRAVLIGQSLGSFVIQQVLDKYPLRVAATVHIGGVSLYPRYSRLLKPIFPIIVGLCKIIPKKTFYSTFARHRANSPETQQYMEEAITNTGTELVLKITKDMGDDLTQGVAQPQKRPTLIMYGDDDVYSRKFSAKWHKNTPGSHCAVIPKAHHIANQDNPSDFNNALMAFLEEVDFV